MTTARERILGRVRSGLAQSAPALERIAQSAPHAPPPHVHPAQADLAAQFAAELTRLEGNVQRCADDEAALDAIRDLLLTRGDTTALAWDLDQIGLPGLDVLLAQLAVRVVTDTARGAGRGAALQAQESATVCLSGADAAIAESGTLLLRGGAGRPRLASLLAPAHIAVLRASQIHPGLGAALSAVRSAHPDPLADAASLTLITGPSRTGDIEMTLSLGVHGPGQLHVILIG